MLDVRLGSEYASRVNHQMSYFIKRTLRKGGPYAKIHCIGQKHLNHKIGF